MIRLVSVLVALVCLPFVSCVSKDDLLDKLPLVGDSTDDDSEPSGAVACEPWNKLGFDLLGLLHPNYDAVGIARLLPPNSFIGLLDGSFGSETTNLEVLLNSGRVAGVRVHLLNTVCLRNNQCGPSDNLTYQTSPENFSARLKGNDKSYREYIERRTSVYRALSDQHPCVKFFISPMLEHNEDERGFNQAAEWIRGVLPSATIVNNRANNHGTGRGFLECHGVDVPNHCNASSLDGKSIISLGTDLRSQWRSQTAGKAYALGWRPEANCRPANGDFLPINARRDCMTADLFRELLVLTYE